MPTLTLTDVQAARLLALAQQLDPPQTLAQFLEDGVERDVRPVPLTRSRVQ